MDGETYSLTRRLLMGDPCLTLACVGSDLPPRPFICTKANHLHSGWLFLFPDPLSKLGLHQRKGMSLGDHPAPFLVAAISRVLLLMILPTRE